MVAQKKSPMLKVAQIVTAFMCGFFALTMFMGLIWGIILAVVFGVASYFITLYSHVLRNLVFRRNSQLSFVHSVYIS